MFPAIMYILHLEKHKMQKIKTIISTLKNDSFKKVLSKLCGINPSLNMGWRGIMKINVMFAVLESKAVRLGINSPLLSL